jgi:F-type H+-transporting ATPase subunit b
MDNVAKAIEEFVYNSLGVNPIEMVIQLGSTLVLFLVVRFFFWNHITAFLDKRKEVMNEEYNKAKDASKEADLLKQQAESELHDIRQSAKGMYDEAKERGEDERKHIVQTAKEDAERLRRQTEQEIAQEWENAKTDMNNEIVQVATLMAKKIIDKELDQATQKKLVQELTKEVSDA